MSWEFPVRRRRPEGACFCQSKLWIFKDSIFIFFQGLYFVFLSHLPFPCQQARRGVFAIEWGVVTERAWAGVGCYHYRRKRLAARFWSICGKKRFLGGASCLLGFVLAVHLQQVRGWASQPNAENAHRGPQAATPGIWQNFWVLSGHPMHLPIRASSR